MAERVYPAMARRVGRFGVRDRLAAELPGAGVAGAAGLLVMSERLARRGVVARGHGLAYDRNE